MLARKADGRPLTPEEYDQMARFVDRVERKVIAKTEQQHKEEEEKLTAIRNSIPAAAFETSILDGSLPEHVAYTLQEAGYFSIGDMALQIKQNPDAIHKLHGIGEKAMEYIMLVVAELDKKLAEEHPVAVAAVETPIELEAVAETPAETPITEEVQVLTPEEVEQVIDVSAVVTETEVKETEETPEKEPSLEELFTLRPEVLDTTGITEDEDEENGKSKKKGKKKGKSVVVTYDPDRDMTLVQKKHKRGGDGWDWDE